MADIASCAPILPGKTPAWREFMQRCQASNSDYVDSRMRLGIRRESAWLQQTPAGDVVVIYIEADDVPAAFQGMGSSPEPFDEWFRQQVREVHGFDLAEPASPPELVVDYRA